MSIILRDPTDKIITFDAKHKPTMSKDAFAKHIKKMKERDYELVNVRFKNFDQPGEVLKFPFKKYAGPITWYTLVDGEAYKLPKCVAEYVANDLNENIYEEIKGMPNIIGGQHDGSLNAENWRVKAKKYKYGMESLEFMRDDIELNDRPVVEEKTA